MNVINAVFAVFSSPGNPQANKEKRRWDIYEADLEVKAQGYCWGEKVFYGKVLLKMKQDRPPF